MYRKMIGIGVLVPGLALMFWAFVGLRGASCLRMTAQDISGVRGGTDPCWKATWPHYCEGHSTDCDGATPKCVEGAPNWQCTLGGEWRWAGNYEGYNMWPDVENDPATLYGAEQKEQDDYACWWEIKCKPDCYKPQGTNEWHCNVNEGTASQDNGVHPTWFPVWSGIQCGEEHYFDE